jgi:hypothetical protein
MSCGFKTNIVLTVFEDGNAVAKEAKTLAACPNFPMHPKAKLFPSSCGGVSQPYFGQVWG